jgi:hypothetical protein
MIKLLKSFLGIFPLFLLLISCSSETAQTIVDKAIEAHGGMRFEQQRIEFDFRNRHYTSTRKDGQFIYTREFNDSTGRIRDVLTNDSFHREINGGPAKITEERARAFSNSVNSVIYFAVLPFGLNDPAVIKEHVGKTVIKGKRYHEIKVTFEKEGGGKDFEDVFLFWINAENDRMDYFAYSYKSDGGGIRFREGINLRMVGGVIFQDYNNFQPKSDTVKLEDMRSLFEQNQLEKLSVINLENVTVEEL